MCIRMYNAYISVAPLPVRLQGSPYASTGRLEIWRNNTWGSICNERFTIEAANVVCRQLGFDQALDYTPGGYFGQSTGPIHMSNVMCNGNEAAITDCTFSTTHSCDHSQDVGIYCQGILYLHVHGTIHGLVTFIRICLLVVPTVPINTGIDTLIYNIMFYCSSN